MNLKEKYREEFEKKFVCEYPEGSRSISIANKEIDDLWQWIEGKIKEKENNTIEVFHNMDKAMDYQIQLNYNKAIDDCIEALSQIPKSQVWKERYFDNYVEYKVAKEKLQQLKEK